MQTRIFMSLVGMTCVGLQVYAADLEQELPPMTSRAEPKFIRITSSGANVPIYHKFELTIDLRASYDNPFDPEQVDLAAEFTAPSGKKITVSGFFYQPYINRNDDDEAKRPLLDADGPPCWKVRFTPTEAGKYTYRLCLQNRFENVHGQVHSMPGSFEATASQEAQRGFIRISQTNGRYFRFDNGTPFFPVGQNLQNDWPMYKHSRLLMEGGGNCARVWTFCHWTWLEWTHKPGGFKWAGPGDWMRSYAGAGKYNQRIAWIADHHLEKWEREGLFVMLCLGNATGNGELSISGKDRYDSWGGHPYNVVNGGFLDDPVKFWTDERARRLYKQRLRYIVARWGYSPNIWAWEFWNELGAARPEVVAWHKEMAQYLRQIDPNRHLITTSTWNGNADKFAAMWDLPQIDFTQSHHYGALPALPPRVAEHIRRWPKPHIIGEGGGPETGEDSDKGIVDPDGIEFHNSLWAPPMCGAAGTTLPWWWRERIEPRNLFFHYRAVAEFVRDIPWSDASLSPLRVLNISLDIPPQRRFSPVLIAPFGADWGSKPRQNRFSIEPDGTMPGLERFSGELFGHSPARREWRNPPAFEVNFPEPGHFIVHVTNASHGILEIRLDGQMVLRDDSHKHPLRTVSRNFAISVPTGRHEIELDNAGADLIRFGYIILTNYRDAARYPDLDILGQQTDEFAALWIHNRLNQWPFKAAGFVPEPVGPATATIEGLKDGRYLVEWWNTYKGQISATEDTQVRGSTLNLRLPVIQTDIACKIRAIR